MERRGVFSFLGPTAVGAAFVLFTIFHSEGAAGFKPFLNLEALLLVAGGALLCLTAAHPAGEVWRAVSRAAAGAAAGDEDEARRWGEILRHGADAAVGMGGVATLLGMILMLSSIDDVSAVPRRMALSLTASFYGLLLSEAVLIPLSRRVRGPDLTLRFPPPGGGQRRLLVGAGSVGSSVLAFFVILYALSAALAKDLRPPTEVRPPVETFGFWSLRVECAKKPIRRAEAKESERRLHWARPVDFKSEAYTRTFAPGERFFLETEGGRGHRCIVLPPGDPLRRPASASL